MHRFLRSRLGWCCSSACCCSRWMSAAPFGRGLGLIVQVRNTAGPGAVRGLDLAPGADLDNGAPLGRGYLRDTAPFATVRMDVETVRPRHRCSHVLATSHPAASSTNPLRPASRPRRGSPAHDSRWPSASAMPYFGGLLSTEELSAAVEQVKSFSSAFSRAGRPSKSLLRSRVRRRVWRAEKCCSPTKVAPRAMAMPVAAVSLTMTDRPLGVCARSHSAMGFPRGQSAPGHLAAADYWHHAGPMPAYADLLPAAAGPGQLVTSIARTPAWEKGGSFGARDLPRIRHNAAITLLAGNLCGLCHTQIDRTGIYNVDGAFLAGGMRVGYYPHGYSVSRNLTSDPDTGWVDGLCRRSSGLYVWSGARPGPQPVRNALGPIPQLQRRGRDGYCHLLKTASRPAHNRFHRSWPMDWSRPLR